MFFDDLLISLFHFLFLQGDLGLQVGLVDCNLGDEADRERFNYRNRNRKDNNNDFDLIKNNRGWLLHYKIIVSFRESRTALRSCREKCFFFFFFFCGEGWEG